MEHISSVYVEFKVILKYRLTAAVILPQPYFFYIHTVIPKMFINHLCIIYPTFTKANPLLMFNISHPL